MKTQRRHELRTNDLSAFFLDANEWLKKHATTVTAIVVAVAVLFLAITLVRRSQVSSTDAAWETMRQLRFTFQEAEASFITLDRLIDEANDRDFKMTALLNKGKSALALTAQRTEGFHPQFLDRAEEAYQTLLEAYPDRMPVVATALGGLASVEENRFVMDGDLTHRDAARGYLEKLQNDPQFKGTPFQTAAAARLLALNETFQVITMADPLPLPPAPQTEPSGPRLEGVTVKSRTGAPIELKRVGEGPKPGAPQPQDRKSGEPEPDKPASPGESQDSPPEPKDTPPAGSGAESEARPNDDSASQQGDSNVPSPAPQDDADDQ